MSQILLSEFKTPFQTPPFPEFKPDDFIEGIKGAIQIAKKNIAEIKSKPASFKNTIEALEYASNKVELISGIFFNLHSAESNEILREKAKEMSNILTEYNNDVTLDLDLFLKIKEVWEEKELALKLNEEEFMLLSKTYKGFLRSGANLTGSEKEEFRKLSMELAQLSLVFSDHILGETNSFIYWCDKLEDLEGLPSFAIEAAKKLAIEKEQKEKWAFSLDYPSFVPAMTYLKSRKIREELYLANAKKGYGKNEFNNVEIIKKIAGIRQKIAVMLGYKNHAELILEERMAQNPKTVNDFINDMISKACIAGERETNEVLAFAKSQDGITQLQKWDFMYYSEKLKEEKYAFNDEVLRPYFALQNVLEGAFTVAKSLYGISFKERKDIPVYHKDVQTFEVVDENNNHVAVFYADFYPRAGKRNGAWMTQFRGQKKCDGQNVRPHISIVCNFTPASETRPSLLSWDEVKTLFHEFGHALHGMLADSKYESLSGTNVFWDFVELPSQILENWCEEKECLDLFAIHYETKEKIPEELIKKIKDSSSFMEARATLRQMTFAGLDMSWHQDPNLENALVLENIESKAQDKTDFLPSIPGTSISTAFSHIFSGGYSAGYYSYKWAEVLDADLFEVFKKEGILNRKVGERFKKCILSKGGSRHPMDLYIDFKGSRPDINPLLKRAGLL